MTFAGDGSELTARGAMARLDAQFASGRVVGDVFRRTRSGEDAATEGVLRFSGAALEPVMELEGFRWGLRPTIALSDERLRVELRDSENALVVALDSHDQIDIDALRVFAVLDPRMILARSVDFHASGSFAQGRLDCVVDLARLDLPTGLTNFIGVRSTYQIVALYFVEGRLSSAEQPDLPPFESETIVVRFHDDAEVEDS